MIPWRSLPAVVAHAITAAMPMLTGVAVGAAVGAAEGAAEGAAVGAAADAAAGGAVSSVSGPPGASVESGCRTTDFGRMLCDLGGPSSAAALFIPGAVTGVM